MRARIRLNLVPGVGPLTQRALFERFGTASRVFQASLGAIRDVPRVGPKLAERILDSRESAETDPEAELARCEAKGVRIVLREDPEYPESLRRVEDAPSLLYARGTLRPEDRLAVGVVGSRNASPYGRRIGEKLATSLARAGFAVVSGLARGIDSVAHEAALRAGGRTLAVLANGLDSIYPPEHETLAERIVERGALVSESPMLQAPLAGLFLQRNRIISGMALGVVVVEATPRSGGLSTARHAAEQNREVFAVPGPVDNLASQGCHQLIREGAKLVESADHILEELKAPVLAILEDLKRLAVAGGGGDDNGSDDSPPFRLGVDPDREEPAAGVSNGVPSSIPTGLGDSERKLVGILVEAGEPMHIDELIARSRLSVPAVMGMLGVLELRRVVRRNPGQMYSLYHS